jgi:hypothetical protein
VFCCDLGDLLIDHADMMAKKSVAIPKQGVRWVALMWKLLFGIIFLQGCALISMGFGAVPFITNDPLVQKNHLHDVDTSKPKLPGFSETNVRQPQDQRYIVNFETEREHPAFQLFLPDLRDYWAKQEARISDLVKNPVTSCNKDRNMSSLQTSCQSGSELFYAYNGLHFPRTLCGKEIAPKSIQIYSDLCTEPAHYLPDDPPMDGIDMPPISFRRTGATDFMEAVECDIPCEFSVDTCTLGKGEACFQVGETSTRTEWTIDGTEMQFTYFTGTPADGNRLLVDSKSFKSMHYLASRDFKAEIPLSSFQWGKYSTVTPAVDFDNASNSIAFLDHPTCDGQIRAVAWAGAMAQYHSLHAYGSCAHNTNIPPGLSLNSPEDRMTLLQRHLFVLIVEQSLENDYISESVWEALHAGVIPVYYGAANIRLHTPHNSVIVASEIGSKEKTAERAKLIGSDRKLWETFHAWRKEGFPRELEIKFGFLHTGPFCRMCRWAYAKRYGLGWDHEKQVIVESHLSRKTCVSRSGILSGPVLESWVVGDMVLKGTDETTCSGQVVKEIQVGSLHINRTIYSHSGVTDMKIEPLSPLDDRHILRLELPIENMEGAHFKHVHQTIDSHNAGLVSSIAIQDFNSKLTVLTDLAVAMTSNIENVVDIVFKAAGDKLMSNTAGRIRIILEDLNHLKDVRTEYTMSPFAKLQVEDFLEPVEMFSRSKF